MTTNEYFRIQFTTSTDKVKQLRVPDVKLDLEPSFVALYLGKIAASGIFDAETGELLEVKKMESVVENRQLIA